MGFSNIVADGREDVKARAGIRLGKQKKRPKPLQTVKKVKYSVTVIRRRQTTNRKSASPIGAINGAMPLRGDFRAFP